uniref:Uncharacterized protein n=1 Tax=Brassica campestris TaxID=3711 RepID=M4FAY4_BRACM
MVVKLISLLDKIVTGAQMGVISLIMRDNSKLSKQLTVLLTTTIGGTGKQHVKTLHHEVTCKNALLKAKMEVSHETRSEYQKEIEEPYMGNVEKERKVANNSKPNSGNKGMKIVMISFLD